MKYECLREQDVIEAVTARRVDDELGAHLDRCALCRDTADVARAMFDEQDDTWSEAVVPAADVVWLRAQMRARAEAARVASRPVVVVQALGIACAAGAVAGVIGTIAWWLRSWVSWLSHAAVVVTTAQSSIDMAALATRGILLALCVWLVLAPVAVYLAATDD
jgi:hypothetical protein